MLASPRRDCEVMAGELVKAKIAALAYHAGLKDEERSMVQQRWVLEDRCKVCCSSTIANHLSLSHIPCTICTCTLCIIL